MKKGQVINKRQRKVAVIRGDIANLADLDRLYEAVGARGRIGEADEVAKAALFLAAYD